MASQEAPAAGVGAVTIDAPDPLAANYGNIALEELQSKLVFGKVWTTVMSLTEELKDRTVLIRGRVQTIRPVTKRMAFVVVRENVFTVQCVLTVALDLVSTQMVKFANALSRESFIDIEGIVSVPDRAITGATQQHYLGDYHFKSKTLQDEFSPEGFCKAAMYALLVTEELESWPEQCRRERSWLTISEAGSCCRHSWMQVALENDFAKWKADGMIRTMKDANHIDLSDVSSSPDQQ